MDASPDMEQYFTRINETVKQAFDIATEARKQGLDPEPRVDIPLAKNMAERVEGLISVVAPQLVGKGMTTRIEELEKEHGAMDWRVGFRIAEAVAKQEFCEFESKRQAMEVGIRAGFAYLTGGIVSAPLEGFIELKIKKRRDGKDYFSVCYAGPIRGAGGTAAATSVILADYIRVAMGYDPYDPDEKEIERYITEVYDYHERCVNLQYLPSRDELKFLMSHIPVEINGDPTERLEVSNYKDLPRIEDNHIRGGMCLVVAEGISQKAPKLWKRLGAWGEEMGLSWSFLDEFLTLQKKIKAGGKKSESSQKLSPNFTFIKDMVAGRPVLTHPMAPGGFRLRYGRSRMSGFSACSLHPALLVLLDKYIATGTQLKNERPGKGAAVTPNDFIDTPVVLMKDGSVVKVKDEAHAKQLLKEVEELLFLGDILFNYGDFSENGHMLIPPGYCEEWWLLEVEKAAGGMEHIASKAGIEQSLVDAWFSCRVRHDITLAQAIQISEKLSVPLHPTFTYFWTLLSTQELEQLRLWVGKGDRQGEKKLVLSLLGGHQKHLLEKIGLPHVCATNEYVVLEGDELASFLLQLGEGPVDHNKTVLENLGCFVRDKAGVFVGARMGRPEKAKMRKLTGSPHVLFPVGDEGGRMRSFQAALLAKAVTSAFPLFYCVECDKETVYGKCDLCDKQTVQRHLHPQRGLTNTETEETRPFTTRAVPIVEHFNDALKRIGTRHYPDLIKGVRGTSNKTHVPEHIAKGILRAKNEIYVNKDGTTRFDMSELPITHFTPKEIGTPVEKLKELGYTLDCFGKPLENEDQVVEIKPQDIILPCSDEVIDKQADKVLFGVAKFVDELLTSFYKLQPYYNLKRASDLVGHLVIGLAPHISAGMIGRIIGFSQVQALLAHPLWHAALRRDCDGDEACVMLLMDSFLNFSRSFLPDRRGSRTMDAPLVLTSKLTASEVDDQAFGVDTVWHYPLEFYEAACEYKYAGEVKVEQINNRLHSPGQYEGMGYTHPTSSINAGVLCSAYKVLPSMEEKLQGQMKLARKIRAVKEEDVARLVIERHFLSDTKGNLRKFSMQQFRCVGCNEKFRRPPLVGKCTACGGKIIFTISEGSVVKYLDKSLTLANDFAVSPYLKETLELLKRRVEDVFGKEKEIQVGLGEWA